MLPTPIMGILPLTLHTLKLPSVPSYASFCSMLF